MSNMEHHTEETLRMEPWLWTVFSALVPAAVTAFVDPPYRILCVVLTAALLLVGLGMMAAGRMRK
jgi:hypothetical protein